MATVIYCYGQVGSTIFSLFQNIVRTGVMMYMRFRESLLVPLFAVILFAISFADGKEMEQNNSFTTVASGLTPIESFGDGRKFQLENNLKLVILRGSWHEMGRQYGKLLNAELKHTLLFAQQYASAQSDNFFSPGTSPSGMNFMDNFFVGVSETSDLTMAQLIRANGVEVAYANKLNDQLKTGGKCSALAVDASKLADGNLVFCRNYDWLPSFSELDLIICILQPEKESVFASINFAGCFYLTTGMNSHGLFIELNSGMFASTLTDLQSPQNAWILWNILRESTTLEEASTKLQKSSAAGHYLIGLADAKHAAVFEWAVEKPSVLVPLDQAIGYLAFSNHFIQPGWDNLPTATAGGVTSSVCRRTALLRQAQALPDKATLEDLKKLLSITVEKGGATWDGTLFQVIAIPSQKQIFIRQKNSTLWHSIKVELAPK